MRNKKVAVLILSSRQMLASVLIGFYLCLTVSRDTFGAVLHPHVFLPTFIIGVETLQILATSVMIITRTAERAPFKGAKSFLIHKNFQYRSQI